MWERESSIVSAGHADDGDDHLHGRPRNRLVHGHGDLDDGRRQERLRQPNDDH
jgi:hypothetical protein